MAATLSTYGFKEVDKDPDSPDFPKPDKKFKLIWERFFASIEEPYFFVLSTMRDALGWTEVDKIKDIFSASETSAFYGSVGSRLSIAQDRVMTYSKSIGMFLTELFKMARELRIIEQRIDLNEATNRGQRSADKALKGLWVDLVDGGPKNPSSIISLSREAGFSVLMDLFFGTYIQSPKDQKEIGSKVDEAVNRLKFNQTMKSVLARKLVTYLTWKQRTFEELKTRKLFMQKHIRQYYLTIRMYTTWLRPYLTHVKRLGMDESKLSSPDLVAGFETSMTELELMFKKPTKKGNYYSIINVHFLFKTQPKMDFHQDGYQHRGPIHVGKVYITFRGYVWDKKQIEEYKKFRAEEDFELLGAINDEIKAALDNLSDDIKDFIFNLGEKIYKEIDVLMHELNIDYNEVLHWEKLYKKAKEEEEFKGTLKEYIEKNKKHKKDKIKLGSIFDPFKHLVNGFSEMITGKEIFRSKEEGDKKKDTKPTKAEAWQMEKEKEDAKKAMLGPLWNIFKVFKKAHGMLAW